MMRNNNNRGGGDDDEVYCIQCEVQVSMQGKRWQSVVKTERE